MKALDEKLLQNRIDCKENGVIEWGSHFEIGQLHSDRYYYVKRFFQHSENVKVVSALLLERFREDGISLEQCTLVGYGSYSGQFLRKTLAMSGVAEEQANFALVEKKADGFSFLFEPRFHKQVLVVMPVTCTFNTPLQIARFLQKYVAADKNGDMPVVLPQLFSVLLVADIFVQKLSDSTTFLPSDRFPTKSLRKLYKRHHWTGIDSRQVFLGDGQATPFTGGFLHVLPAELRLAGRCEYCFPENETEAEVPLLPTRHSHDTPAFVLNLPDYRGNHLEHAGKSFNEVFRKSWPSSHLHGHITIGGKNFLNYIRSDLFYEQNKAGILTYFIEGLRPLVRPEAGEKITRFVIVTPGNFSNSTFLEDLINSKLFSGTDIEVSVIPFQTYIDTYENFVSIHEEQIRSADRLAYFDEVIAGGLQCTQISHYIRAIRSKDGRRAGFDVIMALIDRSTQFSKSEVHSLLAHHPENGHQLPFLSFFKLNIPHIELKHVGDPITERKTMLLQLFGQCHLDALKLFVGHELLKGNPVSLPDLMETYYITDLKHFPFTANSAEYDLYRLRYTLPVRNLIKMEVHHDISIFLADSNKQDAEGRRPSFSRQMLEDLLQWLCSEEKLNAYFFIESTALPGRALHKERELIREIALRTLSDMQFRRYKNIYEAVFNYNNEQLAATFNRYMSREQRQKATFSDFMRLRFHIRRSVDLNSNFIISRNFLLNLKQSFRREAEILAISEKNAVGESGLPQGLADARQKNLAYRSDKINSYKYFLLHCYKELIFKNPSRSITLEVLQNDDDLLPNGVGNTLPGTTLEDLLTDPFYQLGRILKSENIHLLHELKEMFMRDLATDEILKGYSGREIADRATPAFEAAFRKEMRARYLRPGEYDHASVTMARKFIAASKDHRNATPEAFQRIENAVLSMLYTTALLKSPRNPAAPRGMGDTFHNEIKSILNAASKIIGEDLQYYFFIEYRKRVDNEDTSGIYVISSDEREMWPHTRVTLDPDGLIYNTLYGLKDYQGGNMQTFLALARSGNRMLSFRPHYYRDSGESPVLAVDEAFQKDFQSAGNGMHHLKEAEMVLLFRLAATELAPDTSGLHHSGQAVLAICSKTPATIKNFVEFVNVERVRLLLLIKEQILEYLQRKFDSDVFIEIMEAREFRSYQRGLKHGIPDYIEAMRSCMLQRTGVYDPAYEIELHRIIGQAVIGQICYVETSFAAAPRRYTVAEVRMLLRYVFETPFLGSHSVEFDTVQCEISATDGVLELQPYVLDVVMVEIVINMKKNCPRSGDMGLSVTIKDNKFTFRNKRANATAPSQTFKAYGGIAMCRKILESVGATDIDFRTEAGNNGCFLATFSLVPKNSIP
ncbi:hypothetical protein [Chitinophaga sp.]|uniref:hypothetical protein n=1 Tax=Chitinophaga sp. TaxID=1869181 RepID=UPI0031D86D91